MINIKNKLVKGSLILIFLVGIFNVLNFLYHLLMARIMPIEDFGLLKRVFAFMYIGAIFMESIQTVVVKYASKPLQGDGKLKNIFLRTTKGIVKPAIIAIIAFLVASLFISPLFNIPYTILFITSLFIAGSMFAPIARGILQGQQRFFALGGSMICEAILKIGISFLLVYFGWGVFGAIGGVVISLILSLGLSLIYIKKILKSKSEFAELGGIKAYSKPVFIVTLVLILFLNVDILLAGYFFNDFEAGVYAISSTIALIIFIGIQPINKVLFPITANESAEKKPSKQNFIRAVVIVSLICVIALTVIISFTEELIYILSNKILPQALMPTIILSLGTTFLSLSSTILYYKLSRGNTQGYKYVLSFLIFEVILLTLFSSNVLTYSYAFLVSNILFFIGSVVLLRK